MADPVHVLVVDDDDDVRETLGLVLEAEGFRVSSAANGEQALEAIRRVPAAAHGGAPGAPSGDGQGYPVVLLDLRMPVMTGWDVIDELRREGRLEAIPILICTSSPEDSPAGFPIVPKPVQLPKLVAAIRAAAGAEEGR